MRLVVAAFVLVLSFPGSANGDTSSPETTETTVDLRLIEALLVTHYDLTGKYPEPPEEALTIREFSRGCSKEISERLPRKDAWATPFMVVGSEEELFVASAGADRIHDAIRFLSQGEEPPDGKSRTEMLGDDIVLVVGGGGEVINGAASMSLLQRRTMADLRSLGTAIESFSIDNNVYPVQDRDLLPVKLIKDALSPVYIRTAPLTDAWGNEFLMWGTEEEFVVMSLGADGQPDQYYGFVDGRGEVFPFKGATDDPADDIIFASGQFVQWPRGTQL